MSHSDAWEYNRTCDVCWRRLTTLDDICETCEDHLTGKIQENPLTTGDNMNNENTTNNNADSDYDVLETLEILADGDVMSALAEADDEVDRGDLAEADVADLASVLGVTEQEALVEGVNYFHELEMEIVNLKKQVTELHNVNEDYRSDVRSNVGRIQKVLHDHARDCDDQDLIDGLIDQINAATRNGFPELERCRREFDLTITYVISVQASSEEDARDQFIDGEYDHLIELSDYHEFDAEEGY